MAMSRDSELERLASNNPAVTAPASSFLKSPNNVSSKRRPKGSQRLDLSPSTSSITPTDITQQDDDKISQPVSKYERGWRRIVRNFSPSWFSTTMGTGIVSLLFISIPFQHPALSYLSAIFFCLNLVIFTLAATVSILRYTLYPEIWTVMIHDPTNSLFLGTIPMGFATLIESFLLLCCPHWGQWATYLAFSLWIVDAIASLAVTLSLSFILISQTHLQSLDRITAAQLLPIAATIVSSGAGAETAHALLNLSSSTAQSSINDYPSRLALATYLTSLIMWGMSIPFALTTLVIYYQRLTIHKLPPRETVVSVFLPLGPLGMGSYTILYLGKITPYLLPRVPPFLSHIPLAADIIYIITLLIALLMWSFGLTWSVYAVSSIWLTSHFPFNMGWWGFTFPLGVFAVSTMQLGTELPSLFFRGLGTGFAGVVVSLWVVVAVGTGRGALSGRLFVAPCLRNLKAQVEEVDGTKVEMERERNLEKGEEQVGKEVEGDTPSRDAAESRDAKG